MLELAIRSVLDPAQPDPRLRDPIFVDALIKKIRAARMFAIFGMSRGRLRQRGRRRRARGQPDHHRQLQQNQRFIGDKSTTFRIKRHRRGGRRAADASPRWCASTTGSAGSSTGERNSMARILGLDLGSYSVKGVLLETTLRGDTAEGRRRGAACPPEGERAGPAGPALHELLAKRPLRRRPGRRRAARHLARHPRDHPALLRPEEDRGHPRLRGREPAALRSRPRRSTTTRSPRSDEKGADLLVGVVSKDELTALLELLKGRQARPAHRHPPGRSSTRTCSPHPLQRLPRRPRRRGGDRRHRPRAHQRRHRPARRRVELARTFAGGGLDLTKALATEFKIRPRRGAAVEGAARRGGRRRRWAPTPSAPPAPSCAACSRCCASCAPPSSPTPPAPTAAIGRVLLCGGTARLHRARRAAGARPGSCRVAPGAAAGRDRGGRRGGAARRRPGVRAGACAARRRAPRRRASTFAAASSPSRATSTT